MNVALEAEKFLREIEEAKNYDNHALLNVERESVWHRQYAIFVLELNPIQREQLPFLDGLVEDDCDFDRWNLREKLFRDLTNRFEGCIINYSDGCKEYEIIGPDYGDFSRKHSDELEKLAMESEEHTVFDRY